MQAVLEMNLGPQKLMLFSVCIYEFWLIILGQMLITEQGSVQALSPLQSFCDSHLSSAGAACVSGGHCKGLAGPLLSSVSGSSSSSTGCMCPSPAWDLPFWG